MAKYVELRRHTDNEADVLTPEGVRVAVETGSQLTGGYDVLVSSGAQRATQTLACFLAGLGEKALRGVVVEPGLRSSVEDRWRAAYEKAGSGTLQALREADPELVEEDSRRLRPRCDASSRRSPRAGARSSSATAPRTRPPFSGSRARSSSRSRRAAACSSSRRTEPSESRSSARKRSHRGQAARLLGSRRLPLLR
jgi:NAD(P)-dependent dehydrogenase (short-subunit alcohol dehydrogenase family)